MEITRKIKLGMALMMVLLVHSLNVTAATMFPEDIFITLKDSGELAQYQGQKIWKGAPVMLYNSITPDGKRLVVSSPKMKSVYVFDAQSHKRLAQVRVGVAPKGLKVSPNGKEVYVANEGEATISVIDLASYKNVATIKVKERPHNIRFSDTGQYAYVTLQGGAGLGVIDTNQRELIKVIATPGLLGPHNLDLSKDGKLVYIRDVSGGVGVVDLQSETVVDIIAVGMGHAGIDVSPDGKRVYTGSIADDIVTVIDAKTRAVVKTIKVGFGPHGVRTSKDSRWLYVVITAEDKLVVIDTKTLKVDRSFDISGFPFWVAVNGNP